jgi:hypothetical protein
MEKITGFNQYKEICDPLSEESVGCRNKDGSPTAKLQNVLLHNQVLELKKEADSMYNVIEDLESRIVAMEKRFENANKIWDSTKEVREAFK